jgi:hypothetical protein
VRSIVCVNSNDLLCKYSGVSSAHAIQIGDNDINLDIFCEDSYMSACEDCGGRVRMKMNWNG